MAESRVPPSSRHDKPFSMTISSREREVLDRTLQKMRVAQGDPNLSMRSTIVILCTRYLKGGDVCESDDMRIKLNRLKDSIQEIIAEMEAEE